MMKMLYDILNNCNSNNSTIKSDSNTYEEIQ